MGRHRTDPLGMARLTLIGLGVILLLALVVVGTKALFAALGPAEIPSAAPSSSASSGTSAALPATSPAARAPTLQILCDADTCPVFVRVPGGNVLIDQDMARGEQASYFEPELDVVLGDAGTVQVMENGKPRSPGRPGERATFKVTRVQ